MRNGIGVSFTRHQFLISDDERLQRAGSSGKRVGDFGAFEADFTRWNEAFYCLVNRL